MDAPSKLRMLVVDDEPDMLEFVERVTRRKYDVTACSSADDALAALRAAPFDVLITDQKMPRVSGLELLERIAGQYPSLVRVLLSGFTDVPALERAIELGHVHGYVLKPVDSHRLLAAVDQAYRVRDGAPFLPPEESPY